MDDTISRAAAIDAMEQAKERYFDRRVIIGKMQDIVSNLPSQQEQQWIPVSERPPETDGYYLVTIKTFGWNGEQYEDVDIARYERKNGWLKADKCTAWTPLPKPYYGGES